MAIVINSQNKPKRLPSRYSRRNYAKYKSHKINPIFFINVILIVLAVVYGLNNFMIPTNTVVEYPDLSDKYHVPFLNNINNSINLDTIKLTSLEQSLLDLVKKYKAKGLRNVEYLVRDSNNNKIIAYDADRLMRTASLYKLYVLWKVQENIATGQLSDKTQITLTSKMMTKEDYLGPVGSTVSVEYCRKIMIENSHNTASLALAETVGWENIEKTLKDNGLINTDMYPAPKSTASQIYKFIDGVINKNLSAKLRNEDYDLMLQLMKNQQVKTNLNPGFPDIAEFAHKTGNLVDDNTYYAHDAGFLLLPNGRYINIVVMTDGNYTASHSFMKEMGENIWDKLI